MNQPTTTRGKHRTAPLSSAIPSYLPGVQGLRTVAALLVAIYHIWFGRVSGAVDVFFVVAGYFATKSLMKMQYDETLAQSAARIGQYWLRTLRRLIPLTVVVVAATVIAALLWMPVTSWQYEIQHALGSLLFYENWHLISASADYLQQDASSSAFQQFWALSLQGQFYLTVPFILLISVTLARRRNWGPTRTTVALLSLAGAASLAYALYLTAADQPVAYFHTLTRAWEFIAGAILFLTLRRGLTNKWLASTLGWSGVVVLIGLGATVDVSALFPGVAALVPVAAAIAIIVSCASGRDPAILTAKPMTWFGDSSFGFYLWHWPLVILYRLKIDEDISVTAGLAILALAAFLAYITTKLIETPIREWPRLQRSPRNTIFASVVALALPLILIGGWQKNLDDTELAALKASCSPFDDVDGTHEFCDEIRWMKDQGVFQAVDGDLDGDLDGKFDPGGPMTQGAAAALLFRLVHPPETPEPACTGQPLSGADGGREICGYIAWASDQGVINLDPDADPNSDTDGSLEVAPNADRGGSYQPDALLTRAALATYVARTLRQPAAELTCDSAPFTDVSVDSSACGAISLMKAYAPTIFSQDDDRYLPAEPASRAFTAALLYQVAEPMRSEYDRRTDSDSDTAPDTDADRTDTGDAPNPEIERPEPIPTPGISIDEIRPPLAVAKKDYVAAYNQGCDQKPKNPEIKKCTLGIPGGTFKIAVVGGSHSSQWTPAIDRAAKNINAEVTTMMKGACRFGDISQMNVLDPKSCQPWAANVLDELIQSKPDLVITIATRLVDGGEEVPDAYTDYFKVLAEHNIDILGIRENPRYPTEVPICLSENDIADCAVQRSDIYNSNVLDEISKLDHFTFVDIADDFCTNTICPVVRDDVLVYRDKHHLSNTWVVEYGGTVQRAVEEFFSH